ncbi:MAG: nucleoside monophosphate kinase [Candidatus Azambacteria bacterium]|nr:nucleoside monophosphate kinase [Candidatus Azambacteria bacterium]
MEKGPFNLIMLGRSGSGKGTQAQILAQEFNLEYIGTGDLLRKFSEQKNAAARRMKETMAQGKLTPSWMPFFIWMQKLAYTDAHKGVLFDGSPRMLGEAITLDEVLDWFDRKNVEVLLIDISRDTAHQRLLKRRVCGVCKHGAYVENEQTPLTHCQYCGGNLTIRAEDNPDGIDARLDWFDAEVTKVIEHYRAKGNLIVVSGETDPETVHREILEELAKKNILPHQEKE